MYPRLRRDNRIRTIHASLAIENNSLSLDQVTDIINDKRILGAPDEISEVKNAFEAKTEDFNCVKIRFNQFNGENNPMDEYLKAPEIINTQWLLWRTKQRYFNVGKIAICLLKLSEDMWLLTTIKKITKELNVQFGINYEADELKEYKPYYGRVIIKFHKIFQTQCVFYEKVFDQLEINQILPSTFEGDNFPGYDKVRMSYSQLESVLNRWKQDWIAALENQKGVYLITDKHNGKLYVGSATSNNGMLLQRWKSYISNGHGGNKELIERIRNIVIM